MSRPPRGVVVARLDGSPRNLPLMIGEQRKPLYREIHETTGFALLLFAGEDDDVRRIVRTVDSAEFPDMAEAIRTDSFMANAPRGLDPMMEEIEAVLRDAY